MHPVQTTETIGQVRMEARLPVSFRDHGAAAPNPAKLSQLDRIWISPLNPLRGLLPSRPPGGGGGNLRRPGVNSIVLADTTRTQSNFLK